MRDAPEARRLILVPLLYRYRFWMLGKTSQSLFFFVATIHGAPKGGMVEHMGKQAGRTAAYCSYIGHAAVFFFFVALSPLPSSGACGCSCRGSAHRMPQASGTASTGSTSRPRGAHTQD